MQIKSTSTNELKNSSNVNAIKSKIKPVSILPLGLIVYSRQHREMKIIQHYFIPGTDILHHYGLNPTDKSYHGDVPAVGWLPEWIVVPGQQLELFGGDL